MYFVWRIFCICKGFNVKLVKHVLHNMKKEIEPKKFLLLGNKIYIKEEIEFLVSKNNINGSSDTFFQHLEWDSVHLRALNFFSAHFHKSYSNKVYSYGFIFILINCKCIFFLCMFYFRCLWMYSNAFNLYNCFGKKV